MMEASLARRARIYVFAAIWLFAVAIASCGHGGVLPQLPSFHSNPEPQAGQVAGTMRRMDGTSPQRVEHLTTWLAVGGPGYNAPGGNYSAIAPYVDWALTRQGPSAAKILNELNAAGIISVYYTDPNRQNVGGPE